MSDSRAQWTIFTYIAAHNNLEYLGRRSLDQILDVGSTSQLKLAALYDRQDGATRYIVGEPGKAEVIEDLNNFDSGDPDALLETVRWAFELCPAAHYGLVLWSHGSGWRPEDVEQVAREARGDLVVSASEAAERAVRPGGRALFRTTLARILKLDDTAERAICFDDGSGHSLDTLELGRIMCEVQSIIGQPLDLLGMDACLMATLEVAYQLRHHVRFLVASEELVPGYSWPYDMILGELRSAPEMLARELAELVVRHYIDFYTIFPPTLNYGDVTKVALDLTHVGELVKATDGLACELLEDMENQAKNLWIAQYETEEKESLHYQRKKHSSKFGWHLWDVGTMAAHLAAHSENMAVQAAAKKIGMALKPRGAVVAEGHRGEWFDGIGGASIYIVPPNVQRISPYYVELELAQDTRWDEMLEAYHEMLL